MYVKSIGKCQQCLISLVLILLEGLWLLSMSVVADHHGSALWLWLADHTIEMETGLSLKRGRGSSTAPHLLA